MLTSEDFFNSGSYLDLRARVLQRMRTAHINDQVFELVQEVYDDALSVDNLVLSRFERRRLLAEVLKAVVDDMNRRLAQV